MKKQVQHSLKVWQRPVLGVLCRGESQESVLAICKQAWGLFGGPGDGNCADGQGLPWIYVCNNSSPS